MNLHQQILSTEYLPPPGLIAPPPWTLTGNGCILLYRFPKKFILNNGFLADYQLAGFEGFLGSVMLVDYHTTPVGPYRELLFIPGLFKWNGRYSFSISKIYVSSHDSVWNGIENWGIPKEQCDFELSNPTSTQTHFRAIKEKSPFFEATIERGKFSFPLTTAFFPLRITQRLRNDWVLTQPQAKGKAYWGKLKEVSVNPELFPDLSSLKPLATLVVENFQMTFPPAQFEPFRH
ncbi:MAG: hypothetical protein ACK4GN_03300 [Runella sp.]